MVVAPTKLRTLHNSQGIAIAERFQITGGNLTENMPIAGSATYTGVAVFEFDEQFNEDVSNVEILARMSMTANFAGSTVDGRFDNFRDFDNTKVDGSLVWQQTNIVDNVFETTASGKLSRGGESADVKLGIAGGFFGENAEFVTGESAGTYTTGDFVGNLSGFCVGEK